MTSSPPTRDGEDVTLVFLSVIILVYFFRPILADTRGYLQIPVSEE